LDNLLSPFKKTEVKSHGKNNKTSSGGLSHGQLLDEEYNLSASEDAGDHFHNNLNATPKLQVLSPEHSPTKSASEDKTSEINLNSTNSFQPNRNVDLIVGNLMDDTANENIRRMLIKRHSPVPPIPSKFDESQIGH
jgi:hypothetical protein